jgi:hypothetical protein
LSAAPVSLLNYFQCPFTEGIRINKEMMDRSQAAFMEVLSILQPRVALVFSLRAWRSMPKEHQMLDDLFQDGIRLARCLYLIPPKGTMAAIGIHHPRGLSPRKYHPLVSLGLQEAINSAS